MFLFLFLLNFFFLRRAVGKKSGKNGAAYFLLFIVQVLRETSDRWRKVYNIPFAEHVYIHKMYFAVNNGWSNEWIGE